MVGMKLLLMICAWASIVSAANDLDEVFAAEKGNTVLPCPPLQGQSWTWKAWYYGVTEADTIIQEEHLIYREFKDGTLPTVNLTDKTTIDEADFSLTINDVLLSDNLKLTCRYADNGVIPKYYDQARIQLIPYIQPKRDDIEVETVPTDLRSLEEGVQLEVTCTIPRLYPNITEDNFTMTWGDDIVCPGDPMCKFVATKNSDPSTGFSLVWNKELNRTDDGKQVLCTVIPEPPATATESLPLTLNVSFTLPGPVLHGGLSDGEIAGIVVGSVAGIILISAGVYLGIWYNKKGGDGKVESEERDRDKGDSGGEAASQETGEARQHQSEL